MWSRKASFCVLLSLMLVTGWAQSRQKVNELLENGQYAEAKSLCEAGLKDAQFQADHFFYQTKLGDAFYFLGDLKESLRNYLLALDYPAKDHPENLVQKLETTSYAGFCYLGLGVPVKAQQYFQGALEQAFVLGDSVEIATAYYNLSSSLLRQGLLDQSMDLLQKAYEIDVIRKDTAGIGFDLVNMGSSMLRSGQAQLAQKYYRQSIELLARSTGNYNSLGIRYGLLAEAKMNNLEWDSAAFYTQQAISAYEKTGTDTTRLAVLWIQLAKIACAKGDPKTGILWGQKAKNVYKQDGPNAHSILANFCLADAYAALARYSESGRLLEENELMSRELGLLGDLQKTYEKQALLLESKGSLLQALQLMKKSQLLKDSLQLLESQKAAEAMRVRYDAERIESENRLLAMENEVQKARLSEREAEVKNLILYGSIVLILVVAALVIIGVRARLQTRLLLAEISELRTRIKGVLDFSPEDVGMVKEQINSSLGERLTDREFEILNLALTNLSNSEIADKVHVSVNTVKFHLKNIYTKLGVSNRKEALKFVVQTSSNT